VAGRPEHARIADRGRQALDPLRMRYRIVVEEQNDPGGACGHASIAGRREPARLRQLNHAGAVRDRPDAPCERRVRVDDDNELIWAVGLPINAAHCIQ
jgi:hypothetical protein